MKVRILENVETDLTEEDILSMLPEDIDKIGISEVKVKNCLVRYFLHKKEIVVMEVKPLPEEVDNSNHKNIFLAFLQEESSLMSDKDLYLLYKTYKDKSFIAYVDGNNKDYIKYEEYKNVLHEEIISRCDREC